MTRSLLGSSTQLMPTMAWLAGLPLSRELVGTPLYEAFDPDWARAHRPAYVASYGPRDETPQSTRSTADEGLIESLRALGYVE